jgi:CRISPR-associated Csx3 family protein
MEYLKNDFISFEVKDIGKGITSIHFELKRQLEPQDLKNIHPPIPVINKFFKKHCSAFGKSSDMALWIFSSLFSSSKGNCFFYPRLEAGVVVESHTKEIEVGDLIKIEEG